LVASYDPSSAPVATPFFAITVFARGLAERLFTRAYLPGFENTGAMLSSLPEDRRRTMVVHADGTDLTFDIHCKA
jgi:protocatechuate 3,4-dioxygenase alpha subunit